LKAEYLPTFLKDLKNLHGSDAYRRIHSLAFVEIDTITTLTEIPNLKRLRGSPDAFRIRIGDYRVGIFVRNDVVVFA
jgi:mRNA-degrading endonuclease RelE of RelBE toxin-antitoxin system